MSATRRSVLAGHARRRTEELRLAVAGEVRSARERRRWTQSQLATRAGISRHVVGRLERAETRLDVELLQRIGIALDRPLEIRFGRDPHEPTADAGHLAMQELVLRLGRSVDYTGSFELATRPAEPWRSIDVCLASQVRRAMILNECWNTFGDLGSAARSTMRKTAELEALAAARYGPDARVGTLWIVRATSRNRQLLDRYPEIFASRFPGSSRQWVAALTTGADFPDEPGLVWCDIAATRLFAWRRR